ERGSGFRLSHATWPCAKGTIAPGVPIGPSTAVPGCNPTARPSGTRIETAGAPAMAEGRKQWDSTFDLIKGALVLWMIVRHTVIIASTAEASYFVRYINFLSGSFIFVMGYMVGRFAQRKFEADPVASSWRLASRGAKILLIYLALNVLIQASGFGNAGKQQSGFEALVLQLGDFFT